MSIENTRYHTVTEGENSRRLDSVVGVLWEDISRTYVKKLILSGQVQIQSKIVKEPKKLVEKGQKIIITVPIPVPIQMLSQDIPLDIIYEDQHILVINKPAGLVVHPAVGNLDGTLVNALLHYCKGQLSGISGKERPGIVHRLDKGTSGLMVVAKTNEAHLKLAEQFSDRTLSRTYIALVHTLVNPASGIIVENIGRNTQNRQKMTVVRHGGKPAITHYNVKQLFFNQQATLLECKLETGRTHQIRVHMTHKGWPLVGDTTYGRQRPGRLVDKTLKEINWPENRQALHACKLSLKHPISGNIMIFEAPMPKEIETLIKYLKA